MSRFGLKYRLELWLHEKFQEDPKYSCLNPIIRCPLVFDLLLLLFSGVRRFYFAQ